MVTLQNSSVYIYSGFVQGGGFNHAEPEKADERAGGGGGGGRRHFFFLCVCASFTLLGRGTVRLPDRPPG